MDEFKIVMPKLGESIQEATITRWFVKNGDIVEEETMLFEVATDKVDSEIPSPVAGKISDIRFPENTLVPVGEVVATILLVSEQQPIRTTGEPDLKSSLPAETDNSAGAGEASPKLRELSNRFYSPLVKRIAVEERISLQELQNIQGSGTAGRVQKKDLMHYLNQREISGQPDPVFSVDENRIPEELRVKGPTAEITVTAGVEDQIIEMDRIRKLIAGHMVMSKQVSPHVTTVVEADVTNLVLWRNRIKDEFQLRYGEKLSFMPVFIEATAMALREFPMVNSSVDGDNIILRKHINIGIAVARPDGNLIVPVIKDADEKNLAGLAKNLNHLASAARAGKLSPEDIREGSFSITNFGSFRNLIGTPIIHQPQAAILATGSIEKKPAVLELPSGDVIAIRHKMYLSLSYDHRIIDGALGGAFLRRIADILEDFNVNRTV